ncbi:MAG: sulfite exporter TauE/SafE family protein [Pseudomonadota bacterium]
MGTGIEHFVDLDIWLVSVLFVVGFIGGMVSGFIGSGGAFVMTPAMMSLGVPGIVAVASNMCHKFPKALVGAYRRAKFGQVDLRLGLFMGASAEAGVLFGAQLQENIRASFGDAGSNLYVSFAFVLILAIVGTWVLIDTARTFRSANRDQEEKPNKLALWIRTVHIPYTMVYFPSIRAKVSFLVTIPLGFATGMLAATIAVGGFIGVPAMIYILGVPSVMATATELVIAFVMGLGGTIKYSLAGFVDIRLAMIILAGSLFGLQIGAIGTTYVKPYVIKAVMGGIMMVVLISRLVIMPVYLADLDVFVLGGGMRRFLEVASFGLMALALFGGAAAILGALLRGMAHARREAAVEAGAGE